jgi:hypothetical protein
VHDFDNQSSQRQNLTMRDVRSIGAPPAGPRLSSYEVPQSLVVTCDLRAACLTDYTSWDRAVPAWSFRYQWMHGCSRLWWCVAVVGGNGGYASLERWIVANAEGEWEEGCCIVLTVRSGDGQAMAMGQVHQRSSRSACGVSVCSSYTRSRLG